MSAESVMLEAAACGSIIKLDGDSLVMEFTVDPSPELIAKLKEHKAEIIEELRFEVRARAAAERQGVPYYRVTDDDQRVIDDTVARANADHEAEIERRKAARKINGWGNLDPANGAAF